MLKLLEAAKLAAVNDLELLELYNANRSELFPALRQKGALTPLVILVAVLTPLFAQVNDGIDIADARWGLASLEFVSDSSTDAESNGEGTLKRVDVEKQPLAAVLTAWSLKIPWISLPVRLSLLSVLSAIGVVLVWHSLCQAMLGARFAFWSAVIVACHGPFLVQSQAAASTLLTLLLMLCALWGLFSHLRRADGIVSGHLLCGGITLGLCLLTNGMASVAVVVLGMLMAMKLRFCGDPQSSNGSSATRSHWYGNFMALKSVAAMALTAFAVGGWWVMRAATQSGAGFWPIWLGVRQSAESTFGSVEFFGTSDGILAASIRLVELMDVLFIPAVFGLWCVLRELWTHPVRTRRLSLQFLCVWLLIAFVIWAIQLRLPTDNFNVAGQFLMLPLVACAVFVIEQIAMRRCGLATAVWLTCASLIFPLGVKAVKPALLGGYAVNGWGSLFPIAVYLSLFALLGIWLLIDVRHHERRQRICLVGLLALLAVTVAAHGFRSVRPSGDEQRSREALAAFQKGLGVSEFVDAQVLIADTSAPPDVEFVIRATRPDLPLDREYDWNGGIVRAAELVHDSKRAVLIVDWRTLGTRAARPMEQKLKIESQFTPIMVHGRRLSAFLLSRRIQPM